MTKATAAERGGLPKFVERDFDAMVMATAALLDAVVVTGDTGDFDRLAIHFPSVAVLSA